MSLDLEEVRKVARLARLSLSAAEEEKLAQQLSQVLGYIETLAAVDVSQVAPLAFAGEVEPVRAQELLREDVEKPGLAREAALAAAPQTDGQTFLVPRILE